MTILVFGHKSPDTDSTGSPIIWAWYLTEIKSTPAEAFLLGEPVPAGQPLRLQQGNQLDSSRHRVRLTGE